MHFDIISLFPEAWKALEIGIIERAQQNQLYTRTMWQLRDYADKDDGRIDDRPYGGGPGMLMQYSPLKRCLEAVNNTHQHQPWVIQLDPTGATLTQDLLSELINKPAITLVCGRYEGIDKRFTDHHVDQCISVGDFVLSGGDLPAMLLVDALVRLLPGSIGNALSKEQDSYQSDLLDYPHYTRPSTIDNHRVPSVLLNGNHRDISRWRRSQALGRTLEKRMLAGQTLTEEDLELLKNYLAEQQQDPKK